MAKFYDICSYLIHLKREAAKGKNPSDSDRYTPKSAAEEKVIAEEWSKTTKLAQGIRTLAEAEYVMTETGGLRQKRLDEIKPRFPTPKEERDYAEYIRRRLVPESTWENTWGEIKFKQEQELKEAAEQKRREAWLKAMWESGSDAEAERIKKMLSDSLFGTLKSTEPKITNEKFNSRKIYCPCCWRDHA